MAAVAVLVLTPCFVMRDELFSINEADLERNQKFIPASSFTNPMPGKTYSFDVLQDRFEPVSICSKKMDKPHDKKINYAGVNIVGVNYNKAVSLMSGLLSEKIVSWLKVERPEMDWELNFKAEPEDSKFEGVCLDKIKGKVKDPDIEVYTVVNVYFFTDMPGIASKVLLSGKPVVVENCHLVGSCPTGKLDFLLPDDWATTARAYFVNFDVKLTN